VFKKFDESMERLAQNVTKMLYYSIYSRAMIVLYVPFPDPSWYVDGFKKAC
jgi:hypothetical protein